MLSFDYRSSDTSIRCQTYAAVRNFVIWYGQHFFRYVIQFQFIFFFFFFVLILWYFNDQT